MQRSRNQLVARHSRVTGSGSSTHHVPPPCLFIQLVTFIKLESTIISAAWSIELSRASRSHYKTFLCNSSREHIVVLAVVVLKMWIF